MKLATFFISSTKFISTKLLSVSERLIKMKVGSHWAVIYKDFCMETRFCNIFKTANAITLSKTILESPYEDLQGS